MGSQKNKLSVDRGQMKKKKKEEILQGAFWTIGLICMPFLLGFFLVMLMSGLVAGFDFGIKIFGELNL
ncbi:hypothetical protein LCGC14_0963590 [marine sediment metagenome]|uniref:Uncharacterized protein n=1 Tax=marine sediment metagenome TaxID=412755 RepID=A0A0F9QWV9_9ZZZZ